MLLMKSIQNMQATSSLPRVSSFSMVIELLHLEADAITKATQRLCPKSVEQAINVLVNCHGKVVLSGVGKSGIVARKIAATLTSIGIAAIFLHPVDALHGDLGVITAEDVVMALSNSGETDELLAMLPSLKHKKVPIIALVGNADSTLAKEANTVLDAPVDREACPLNLAPTTSTTVALAIGDAIAMTLMQIKGLTPENFAKNHPAGRLGKRLTLRVKDLMHSGTENPVINTQANWLEVVSAITKGGLGAVNVVDSQGILVGVITDGDLRRSLSNFDPAEFSSLQATAMMTQKPITVMTDQLAYDALQMMENRSSQISVLPVIDFERKSIGLLRLHDIARSGLL